MPRKNEYTFIVERPLSSPRSQIVLQILLERRVNLEGFDTNAIPRELRSGEAYRLAYPPEENKEAV